MGYSLITRTATALSGFLSGKSTVHCNIGIILLAVVLSVSIVCFSCSKGSLVSSLDSLGAEIYFLVIGQ